jgi:chromosome partitioning protein
MQAAELNIVPSRPSLFDLRASARTRTALEEIGAKFAFLLNQCPPTQQAARVQDGAEALEEMGGLISPLILARVEYQAAARRGQGVTELNPSGAAAHEMRDLWQAVTAHLAQAKVAFTAREAA